MRLSHLQKFILRQMVGRRGKRLPREVFLEFFDKQKNGKTEKRKTKILTRSLERLIDREFMVGYGVRTPHKWYIREVKLTQKGKREAKKLLGVQQELPFKRRSTN